MQKLKIQSWPWIVIGILVVLLAGWIFLRWWNRDVASVKTALVVRGPIEAVISASGLVDAPVYELGPKLGGKIARLRVAEGDPVEEGMTLLEFDDTTRLVSPAEGMVAKINYLEGETVAPGVPALVIVNYEDSWVEAQIDEIDIAGIKIGDKVKITSDVYPEKIYHGEITWIAPLAELRKVGGRVKLDEESYIFPCKIKFPGKHDELKVNMSVNVDIMSKRSEKALLVPREALVSKDDSSTVFVVRKNRAYQTKIDIGIRSFSSVEAVSGVAPGDEVAMSNLSRLKDKGRVKIER
jgi:multidrug efflux pump subunit AcrA (membrane-fusion protein)